MSALLQLLDEILSQPLPLPGEDIQLRGPVTFLLTALLAQLLAQVIERQVTHILDRTGHAEANTAENVRRVVRRPVQIMGVLVGLALAGVNVRLLRETLDDTLFTISDTNVSALTLIFAALVLFASWWASRLIQGAAAKGFRLNGVMDEGTIGVARRLIHYTVMAAGIGIALETVGINLSGLFTAGAVFAVGIGFALQNITENFVSGVILLIERAIKPGDILELDGEIVRVIQMNIRSTVVRTLDDADVIVPNSYLVSAKVHNLTFVDSKHRLRCPVGVAYGADMRKVKEVLERVGRECPFREPNMQAVVLLQGFGSSSVDWELSVWAVDPWRTARQRSDLRQAVWWAFKEADIEIAFPQLDVHLDGHLSGQLGGQPSGRPGEAPTYSPPPVDDPPS